MDEQQGFVIPKAPFPAPPPFWKHFTISNLDQLKQLEAENQSSQLQLPLDLTYLRPPPPPSSTLESYSTFSQSNVLDTTTPALPPSDQLLFDPSKPLNHAVLLTRLTKSLLLNFLELITVLSQDPTQYAEKIEDIRTLTLNIHAVINMYRPHQARESVKEMLEGMLEDGRREIEECDRVKGKVEDFLKDVAEIKGGDVPEENDGIINGIGKKKTSEVNGESSEAEKADEMKRLWKMVHEIGNE